MRRGDRKEVPASVSAHLSD